MRRHPTAPVNVARISVATSGTDFTAPASHLPGHKLSTRLSKSLTAPALLSAAPGRTAQSCPLKIVIRFQNWNLKRDS
jgi:hypothetical protein